MEEARVNVNINPGFLSLLTNSKSNKSIDEKINLSLAIFLFTERAITLARASELAGLGLGDFINILINHNISWSEYTVEYKEQDDRAISYIMEEETKNG